MPNESSISDPQTTRLVRSAQEGDAESLEELCRRYLPRVQHIVALKLGRTRKQMQENEDLVQDAFVRILGSLDTYRKLSTARFHHWVSQCVVNLVRDALKKKKSSPKKVNLGSPTAGIISSSIRVLDPEDDLTPSRVLEGVEVEDLLEKALLRLPEHQRELINLRCLCEMSYEEIAVTLGFERTDTVRVSLHRARRQLKEEVDRLSA